jgi:uncharacterized protein YjiS (DUF1127 family)
VPPSLPHQPDTERVLIMTAQTMFRPMRTQSLLLREVVSRAAEAVVRPILRLPKLLRRRTCIRKKLDAWRHFDEHLLRDLGLSRSDLAWLTDPRATAREVAGGKRRPCPVHRVDQPGLSPTPIEASLCCANPLADGRTRTAVVQAIGYPVRRAPTAEADATRRIEIIAIGTRALRRRQNIELAFDLLGIDGLSLPLTASRRR